MLIAKPKKQLRRPVPTGTVQLRFGAGVRPRLLDESVSAEKVEEDPLAAVPKRKWINVATAGKYLGHQEGEFELNLQVFQQMVTNLRADPRYHAGEDGVGDTPVVPFDYEHASEMAATDGTIPTSGAIAPAWVLDLKVQNDAEGNPELWAFADLGEQIRGQISRNEYLFTSIAFALDSHDPVTDAPVGARISSIAFTNHPFIRDLTAASVAATARQQGTRMLYWFDPAGSPQQGLEYTRQCLGLGPTAETAAIVAEIAKLAGWAKTPDQTPPGVSLDEIFQGLRKIWALPVTSTVDEITAEINKGATQVDAQTTAAPAALPAPVAAATDNQETAMLTDHYKKLATIILKAKRPGRSGHYTLDDAAAVEAAVEELVANTADLEAVLSALGVGDTAATLAALPALLDAKAKLASVASQLEEALSMQAEADASSEAADVAAATDASGVAATEGVAAALSAHRTALLASALGRITPDKRTPKALADARRDGRRAFLTAHGVAPEGQERLLKNLVAGPGGQQLQAPVVNSPPLNLSESRAPGAGPRPKINLTGLNGVNTTDRLLTHVRRQEGGANLSWDELNRRAASLKATHEIVDETR